MSTTNKNQCAHKLPNDYTAHKYFILSMLWTGGYYMTTLVCMVSMSLSPSVCLCLFTSLCELCVWALPLVSLYSLSFRIHISSYFVYISISNCVILIVHTVILLCWPVLYIRTHTSIACLSVVMESAQLEVWNLDKPVSGLCQKLFLRLTMSYLA